MATTVAPGRDRLSDGLVVAVAAAWVVALIAEAGGRSSGFHHDALLEGSLPLVLALGVFIAAWQLMIVAMMLPSTLPMVRLFGNASSAHPEPGRAQAAFLGGYVLVWTTFGAIAFVGDAGLHRTVDATPWLAERPWVVAGALLVAAGGAQFLPLTQACLRSCRHPFAYLLHRFRPGTRAGFQLGRDHGLYCLGCCWGLMLVMFAAGVANLSWMAGLTAVMVYEKVGRHGQRLAPIVGVVLVAWGVLVAAHAGWLPHALSGVT
jgi:predicted metal-binding membrane protein